VFDEKLTSSNEVRFLFSASACADNWQAPLWSGQGVKTRSARARSIVGGREELLSTSEGCLLRLELLLCSRRVSYLAEPLHIRQHKRGFVISVSVWCRKVVHAVK
jgi:hypothetical protein